MTAILIMAGRPLVVIARSDRDAAILFTKLLGIASSLPLLAMTTGLMLACHRHNESRWWHEARQPAQWGLAQAGRSLSPRSMDVIEKFHRYVNFN